MTTARTVRLMAPRLLTHHFARYRYPLTFAASINHDYRRHRVHQLRQVQGRVLEGRVEPVLQLTGWQ